MQGGFAGVGNLSVDPQFRDAANGDHRLACGSPAIDSADNLMLVADTFDLDDDGDFGEIVPTDLAGAARRIDDPATTDTGVGSAPIVDRGAFEFDLIAVADLSGDGVLDGADLGVLLALWGSNAPEADYNCDGAVDGGDLGVLLTLIW